MKMTIKRKATVVIIVLVVLVLAGLAIPFFSYLNYVRRETRQTLCVHNLKLIGLQLRMYADEHAGAFPDKWSTLVTDHEIRASEMLEFFVCPEHSRRYEETYGVPYTVSGPADLDERSSYALVPALHMTDDKDTILVYEKGDNHDAIGHSVLYLDGRGGWDPPSNWR
jgi:hypothetical protein